MAAGTGQPGEELSDRTLPSFGSGQLTNRRQLLALSGGGYRGRFSALVLERLEQFANRPLGQCFDLIAGTSVGGLVACAIAVGIPVRQVREMLDEHAPAIFPRKFGKTLRQLFGTLYNPRALRSAIQLTLREHAKRFLDEVEKPLLLPAVSWTTGKTLLLKSRGIAATSATRMTLLDAALATSAAPTYFPPHAVSGDMLLDGGLSANAPDIAALSAAQARWATGLDGVSMLSIGTAGASDAGMVGSVPRSGLRWMVPPRLISFVMETQERLASEQCAVLLGERYLRMNPIPVPGQKALRALDVVDVSMAGTLEALAQSTYDETIARHLQKLNLLLGHKVQ